MTEENNLYKGLTKEEFDQYQCSPLVRDLESLILRIDQIETLALTTRLELIEMNEDLVKEKEEIEKRLEELEALITEKEE